MRRLQTGLLVWAAWTALAVFFGITTSLTYVSQGRAAVWGQALAFSLAQWWIWALLTPVVVVAARRWPVRRGHLVGRVPLHLAFGLTVAFVKVTAEGVIREWLFGFRPYLLINNLGLQVLIYGALVGLVHALDHYGRSRERAAAVESRLREAQLDLLRAQLRPHFLFNALNTISELVHEDPERADAMIGHLSELLRASIDAGDRQLAPLGEEVALVEHYLAIQRVRFGDRLTVHIDVPDACRASPVPHLILQPLVENAIVHGLAPRASGGTLWIRASIGKSGLVVTVEDDGVGLSSPEAQTGVGLANTRARLAAMYGEGASLEVSDRSGGGVVVTLTTATGLRPTF
jgi:hypothetical protein